MKRMSTNISSKRHEPHTSLKTLISKEPPNESAYSKNIKGEKKNQGYKYLSVTIESRLWPMVLFLKESEEAF